MNSRYLASDCPRLFAHRGSSGHYPENTLPSFLAADKTGIPYLELDVWASRDGKVVIHHDETALRLCGVDRRISDCTIEEIKSFDAGYGFTKDGEHPFRGQKIAIPTLEELFEAFPDTLCNIEIKQSDPPIESLVLDTVRSAGREESVLLAAENDQVMHRLRPLCGGIPTSFSRGEVATFFQWLSDGCTSDYRPPAPALQIPESHGDLTLVSPSTIEAAHALGLEIHVWTVNDPDDMRRLLGWGVDGLMSDLPQLLMEIAGEQPG